MRSAIHYCRQVHTVPMQRRRVVEFVGDIHFNQITFIHKKCRSPKFTFINTTGYSLIACSQLRESIFYH